MIRTLNILPSISRLAGGVAPAVLESISLQRSMRLDVQVATLHDRYTEEDGPRYSVPYLDAPAFSPLGYSPGLKSLLKKLSPLPDLLHSHGMWMYCDYLSFQLSRAWHIPLIVSPHGMLRPWAFRNHWWKKAPIWWLWEKRKHEEAAAIIATSEVEAQDIRTLGIRTPIAIIPHGLLLPEFTTIKMDNAPRRALFLSRIHPVKGLLMLVEAVERLRPEGWKFIIAGPDEHGYQAVIQAAVCAAGMEKLFEFPGPLYGEEKWKHYRLADLFVLPTLSENFGIVIAEALACETPVLTTRGAPWMELETQQCGWWVDGTVEAFARALAEALTTPTETLRQMGQRGRALIKSQYTLEHTASRTLELYEWVLKRRERPNFVMVDK